MNPRVPVPLTAPPEPLLSTRTSVTDRDLRRFLWGAMPGTNHAPSSIGVRVGDSHKRATVTSTRDLSKLTGGAGGLTVATDFSSRLYEHIVETSGVRRTGAIVYTTAGGQTLLVPKTTGQSSATLVAEAGSISESDPVFGQASLGAFKYALLVQVSMELEADTEIDLLPRPRAERGQGKVRP